MKCVVCSRIALEKYCLFHEEAFQNIVKEFSVWKRAMGVSWKEYLKELVEISYTGTWVKEVSIHLLKNKDG
ncbi:hypothetical protein KJN74_00030 [Candidatus Bathyarchaeota archaeon]|nr:hypothetical protein [Candidatus Bathyarchaeota archaeon]